MSNNNSTNHHDIPLSRALLEFRWDCHDTTSFEYTKNPDGTMSGKMLDFLPKESLQKRREDLLKKTNLFTGFDVTKSYCENLSILNKGEANE